MNKKGGKSGRIGGREISLRARREVGIAMEERKEARKES